MEEEQNAGVRGMCSQAELRVDPQASGWTAAFRAIGGGGPPWTAYVKIAEGCSQRCAFCIIPRWRAVGS